MVLLFDISILLFDIGILFDLGILLFDIGILCSLIDGET